MPGTIMDEKLEWVAVILAVGLLLLAGFVTVSVLIWPIPPQNQTLVGQIQGALWGLLGGIVGFFYATSKGNSKQQETIATLTEVAKVAQQTQPVEQTPGKVELTPGMEVKVEAVEEPNNEHNGNGNSSV